MKIESDSGYTLKLPLLGVDISLQALKPICSKKVALTDRYCGLARVSSGDKIWVGAGEGEGERTSERVYMYSTLSFGGLWDVYFLEIAFKLMAPDCFMKQKFNFVHSC